MPLEPSTQAPHTTQLREGASALSETVRVLVNFPLETEYAQAIESVDPRVRILRAYEPLREDAQTPDWASWSSEGSPDWRKVEGEELDAHITQAEIYMGFGFPMEWLDQATNLKWVQLISAGSDYVLCSGLLDKRPKLLLTTASGIHAISIAEHIVAMLLYFTRGFDKAVRNQRLRQWEQYTPGEAYGQTVCLVGYGPIARRAAELCKALGMRALAVRASITEQQLGTEAVARFYPQSDLSEALSQADYIVVAAPSTPRSRQMIARDQFAAMKSSAVLINISRGALVDEAALIDALREGKLHGAGLDVFEQEPLPASSPLWDMPNVLITAHVSGTSAHLNRRLTDLFRDNLARYLQGQPLQNLVDKERGY